MVGLRLAEPEPGFPDLLLISGPPSQKFAVRYTLAHRTGLETNHPVKFGIDVLPLGSLTAPLPAVPQDPGPAPGKSTSSVWTGGLTTGTGSLSGHREEAGGGRRSAGRYGFPPRGLRTWRQGLSPACRLLRPAPGSRTAGAHYRPPSHADELKEGGHAWDSDRKRANANYLSNPARTGTATATAFTPP